MEKIKNFFYNVKEKIKASPNKKKYILMVVANVLVICILVVTVSLIKTSKTHEVLEEGARIEIDCGIRVGFVVDKDFVVEEVYACDEVFEPYIEEIKYETDFVKCATHVFSIALDRGYMQNVDYWSFLASIETKNPDMYERAYIQLNDNVKEDGINMSEISYGLVAITEYDSKIQRIANKNNVPYGVAYVCLELKKANDGLPSAEELMKEPIYIISQMANNQNGKDKNYFSNFLFELSQKNLKAVK